MWLMRKQFRGTACGARDCRAGGCVRLPCWRHQPLCRCYLFIARVSRRL